MTVRKVAIGIALVLLSACSTSGGADGASTTTTTTASASEVAPDFLVERLGGTTSAREFRGRPFNQSARSLSNKEFQRFGDGAVVFDAHFLPEDGLGPVFNEDSCLSCHLDGTETAGGDAEASDEPGPGLLLRLSIPGVNEHGGPLAEPTYGVQLQNRAVKPAVREGSFTVEWELRSGKYPDGTPYELRSPRYVIDDLVAGPLHPDVMISGRIAPPMTGMGLLEAIPEADLVSASDPTDRDGDGISGRVNRVWNDTTERIEAGRLGWKAGQPTVRQQSVAATHDDMGVTTPDDPDPCRNQGSLCTSPSSLPEPEMTAIELADQVFYNRTIAVPIARRVKDESVKRGANGFVAAGCSSCHTTTQVSGPDEVKGLAGQRFHPFTDLLLHDMGEGLSDGRPEFEATGSEWRTAPLWALGRRAEVTGFNSFLHDGRARGIEEAILWHDGEAAGARKSFMKLSKARRADILDFLAAL